MKESRYQVRCRAHDCSQLVVDVRHRALAPGYEAAQVCRCGTSNAVNPPLTWRIARARRKLAKLYRAYGIRSTHIWTCPPTGCREHGWRRILDELRSGRVWYMKRELQTPRRRDVDPDIEPNSQGSWRAAS